MYNTNIPDDRELPSTKKLVKSTIIAVFAALGLLVTVVMPAEYGIDPTGIGKMTGLQKMGEIKMSLAKEAAAESEAVAVATDASAVPPVATQEAAPQTPAVEEEPTVQASTGQNHEMSVTLAPNEGKEIKVDLKKGQKVIYKWASEGGRANYDIHGDSKTLKIDYHNYAKGSKESDEGEIVAAFDGSHGWFWRNRTGNPITVTIQTSGEYSDIKLVK
jgi:cytochrome c5